MDDGAVGVDHEQRPDRHAALLVEYAVATADFPMGPEVRQNEWCVGYTIFEVGGDPCELHRYRVATYLQQFCARRDRTLSDPAKDPELIGSTAGK